MREVVLIDGLRTPIGKFGGGMRDWTAQAMQAHVFRVLLARVDLDPTLIDEVIVGNVLQGSDAVNMGRASGLLAGRFAAAQQTGHPLTPPPETSAHGALIRHVTGGHLSVASGDGGARSFQPMNINFGLLPPIDAPTQDGDGRRLKGKAKGLAKKQAMAARALADFSGWLATDHITSTNSMRLLEGANT